MQRREFMGLVGGAAAWPLAARAQQSPRVARIGVLSAQVENDPEYAPRWVAFVETLQRSGWTEGRNLQIDYRWAAGSIANTHKYAAELAGLAPDVIVANGSSSVGPLLQVTSTVPVVFANVPDPVGAGYVESLARPGGNATGFTNFEYSLSEKWFELLKEIAPHLTRVAVLRDATASAGAGQYSAVQAAAQSRGVEVSALNMRSPDEIERFITAFARTHNGGMVVTQSAPSLVHRALIVGLAARHKLPTVYFSRNAVDGGGLISYGPDGDDLLRRAADYVDRILRGAKAADLPVQAPSKYELAINLKTAKTLGLTVPPTLLARADKVIE
jgi:putative ABC transport system substrate-binding protein